MRTELNPFAPAARRWHRSPHAQSWPRIYAQHLRTGEITEVTRGAIGLSQWFNLADGLLDPAVFQTWIERRPGAPHVFGAHPSRHE